MAAPHTEPLETLQMAALIDRSTYLNRLDRERGGSTPSREAEQLAIEWALRRLVELDPTLAQLFPRAIRRAEERAGRLW
jgi:hypothetical protein